MNSNIDANNNPEEQQEEMEDEELENDLYLIELHKRLTSMKKERKKAQQDAQLLDNRLKLLKGEEDKTLKKIEVTRKKTHEKMVSIQNQEEHLRQKLDLKEQRERELEMKKEMNYNMKRDMTNNIAMKREQKLKQIMEESSMLKMQKKNNEEMLKYIKIEEMANNKSRAEYIKNQQLMMEEKKRALELEKKNQLKYELERKIMEEQNMKGNADDKMVELEQEEIEIMKRIRTTTQVHKAMVEDFEKMNSASIKEEVYSEMGSDKKSKRGEFNSSGKINGHHNSGNK